ncbi:MAG: hypothetical protein R6X33_06130, partial [Candidatus Brocadiia bacterium]
YYPEILDLLTSRSGPVAVHEVYEEVGCSRYHLNAGATIIRGFATGLMSTWPPIVLIAAAIAVAY